MSTVTLKFVNQDATPKVVKFDVSRDGIKPVMAWYGAYHAGDNYTVHVNGVEVEKDENGELVGRLIDV
ncbi:hypothetical protein EVC20_158 [Rhizobium phage RHph_Y2_17_1]|nr:hypothetical protein EVC19_158 [Rhizobium phage RHph_Y2_11]QIG75897.1 hypothetical protein EVC20_158 [Rhizobium phage RHph_Y2_17_1]